MFDITADQIASLDDELLRELIARLCEAEVRAAGHSPLSVTWGGSQTSPDGGIDVRVSLNAPLPSITNLPQATCGFQVKAEDMPRGRILEEMNPSGTIRPSIQALAEGSGAYIIVSSRGSVSDSSLADRKEAMTSAVASLPNAASLYLDFYDRTRLATWVRQHPGITLWVREMIGSAIPGWRPFGDWAYSQEATDATYLLDDKIRIHSPRSRRSISAKNGLDEIREILAPSRGVVRLVGLSGTGKTRFVQALFDERLGASALNPSLAVYTNISDDPSPQPVALASDLIAQGTRAVLIVDNCPPDLHGNLTKVCQRTDSTLSLITIEYDVREDQPEGTNVFELQPASDEIIKQILKRRYAGLSLVSTDAIAQFSCGNARVALALAGTIGPNESVAELRDIDLFQRLFEQRQGADRSLLKSAQACSLVYSFQGEDTSNTNEAELWRLAKAFGIELRTFYEALGDLQDRDLLQSRGAWRALLPHAIANRLAALALEKLLPGDVEWFWKTSPPRLLRSFSRRLGFLHTSERAQGLVRTWLSPTGFLGAIEDLNDFTTAVLVNVAPVAPADTLNAIARGSERERDKGGFLKGENFRVLLRSLAFESGHFDQAFSLLIDLIEHEEPGRYANQARNDFASLFQLVLSGTHATVEQRISALEALLTSNSSQRRAFGCSGLGAMLQTSHFTSLQQFEFGGRHRNYGYQPRNGHDVQHWFEAALAFCDRTDARGEDSSEKIRKIVSEKLRGLWTVPSIHDVIESLCRTFAERRYWPEGWIAVRSIRRFRDVPLPQEQEARLRRIEASLQPRSLQERVRVFVLRRAGSVWDDIDPRDHEAQLAKVQETAIEVGRAVGQDAATFVELLPELVLSSDSLLLGAFVKGLLESEMPRREIWDKLAEAYRTCDPERRNAEILACVVFNLSVVQPDLVEEVLAESATDPVLRLMYPYLQSRVHVSDNGLRRLKEGLADESVPINLYRNLGVARQALSDEALASLIPLLATRSGGFNVALECVWMRLAISGRTDEAPSSEAIIAAGRKLLAGHEFARTNVFDHYHYKEVAKQCLAKQGDSEIVSDILHRVLAAAIPGVGMSFYDAPIVIEAMVNVQPVVALDTIFANRSTAERTGMDSLLERHDTSALDSIPEALLVEWCDRDSAERYPWLASKISIFKKVNNTEVRQWNDVALALLERAPDPLEVMTRYVKELEPTMWSGSRATAWEANATLLDSFETHHNPALVAFVKQEKRRLQQSVAELRVREEVQERRENERFE